MNRKDPRLLFHDIERESNLSFHRVRKGFTEKQLAEAVGTSQAMISALSFGRKAPINMHTGLLLPVAIELEQVLGVPLSELFPAYICEIPYNNLSEEEITDILVGSTSKISSGDCAENIENFQAHVETKRYLFTAIKKLKSSRGKRVIIDRFFEGKSLEVIAEEQGVSRERIRQIEKTALRSLAWRVKRSIKKP